MVSGFCCELPFLFDTSVDKNKTKTTCIILKFSILVWNSMHHWMQFLYSWQYNKPKCIIFCRNSIIHWIGGGGAGGRGTPNLRLKLSQKHPKRPKCCFFTLIEEKNSHHPLLPPWKHPRIPPGKIPNLMYEFHAS